MSKKLILHAISVSHTLGRIAVENNFITEEQLAECVRIQRQKAAEGLRAYYVWPANTYPHHRHETLARLLCVFVLIPVQCYSVNALVLPHLIQTHQKC